MYREKQVILLVEDDAPIRIVMQRVLERDGFIVYPASNAHEAYAVCSQHLDEIDLIFADLILTGKTRGHHLAIELQARKPGLQAIFSSGYDPNQFATEIKLEEGGNFIAKPYSAKQLLDLVTKTLGLKSEKLTTPALSPKLG